MAPERHKPYLKCRVYKTVAETWLLRVEHLRPLEVFDHRCLRSIADVGWCQRIRNETVRQRVFGCMKGKSIGDCIQRNKLRWLGNVLHMPDNR